MKSNLSHSTSQRLAIGLFITLVVITLLALANLGRAQWEGDKSPAPNVLRSNSITLQLLGQALKDTLVFKGSNQIKIVDSSLATKGIPYHTEFWRGCTLIGVPFAPGYTIVYIDTCNGRLYLKSPGNTLWMFPDSAWIIDNAGGGSGSSDSARVVGQLPYNFKLYLQDNLNYQVSGYSLSIDTTMGNQRLIVRDASGDVGVFTTNGGVTIDDSTDFTQAFWNLLQGDLEVAGGRHYIHNVDHADTADFSVLMSADSSVDWAGFTAALKQMIKSDSVQHADTAATLEANAISALSQFANGIQTGYLPTSAQRLALNGTTNSPLSGSAALSGTNKPIDSTGAVKNFVRKDPADIPLYYSHTLSKANAVGYAVFDSAGNPYEGKGTLRITGQTADSTWAFKDSIYIDDAIATDNAGDVRAGTGSSPTTFFISGPPAPGTGVVGDYAVDTVGMLGWVKMAAGWDTVGGAGGGGGAPNPDTVLYTNRSTGRLYETINIDKGFVPTEADCTTSIGTSAKKLDSLNVEAIGVDSLNGKNNSDRILVGDSLIWPLTSSKPIGRASSNGSPNIYCKALTAYSQVNFSGAGALTLPAATSGSGDTVASLGTMVLRMKNIVTRGIRATDSLYLRDGALGTDYGLWRPGVGIQLVNDNLSLTSGSVICDQSVQMSGTGYVGYSNNYMKDDGLHLQSDSAAASLSRAKLFLIPADYYYGLANACDVGGDNPLITQQSFINGTLGSIILPKDSAASLRTAWKNPWDYVTNNLPNCMDSAYVPDFTRILAQGDTGTIGADSGLTFPDSVLGPMLWSKTHNRIVVDEWEPPLGQRKYVVGDQYDDALGTKTGYFKTIQAALDSVPNILAVISDNLTGDTLVFSPATTPYVRFRYGYTVAETLKAIPAVFRNNSWGRVMNPPTTAQGLWTQLRWLNDSTCIAADSQMTRQDLAATTMQIASFWEVEILPNRTGTWNNGGSCWYIRPHAPIHVHGTSMESTVLTNMMADGSYSTTMDVFGAVDLDTTQGLPITISDMTIVSQGEDGDGVMSLDGRVSLRNLKVSFRNSPGSGRSPVFHYANGRFTFTPDENSLSAENVVVVADSGAVIYYIEEPVRLTSSNCKYGISGATQSNLLYTVVDLTKAPQFINDLIWTPGDHPADSLFIASTAQTGTADSVVVTGCTVFGSTFKFRDTGIKALATGCVNQTITTSVEPPVFLHQSQWPIQLPNQAR